MSYSGKKNIDECLWDSAELDEVNKIKFLTVMQVIVMFIVYTIMAYLGEVKGKETKEGRRGLQFVQEFVYEHFMYFILALFVHTLVARAWHLCLLGIYAVVLDLKAFAMQKEVTRWL